MSKYLEFSLDQKTPKKYNHSPAIPTKSSLSHESAGGGGFIFPDRWKLLCLLVVASKSVNPALHKDQPKLGILVLPVPLQMLPNSNSFLNEVVEVLGDFRSKTMGLEYPQNLAARDTPHLSNSMGITKNNTNLRRGQTLLRKLADVFLNILR